MKKFLLTVATALVAMGVIAQSTFPEDIEVPAGFSPTEVLMPPSPLTAQVLFVGGVDWVETTPTYGNPAGRAYAKEWHDFAGFTPDETGESLGWVSINHESIYSDNRIGDGGGMTVFRVRRNAFTGQLEVVDQTLEDGRQGKFFNVDFANTVGETGMNCGGITSVVDGRIWTAEEWFRTSNASINNGVKRDPSSTSWFPKSPGTSANQGVRDTAEYTISSDIPGFDGAVVQKFENFNYMVEIDPKQAVAIRKQYNWGRQGFEGGAVTLDNKTVYLGVDATPAWFLRFVADTPGDFTSGILQAYKQSNPVGERWITIDNSDIEAAKSTQQQGVDVAATMFNRIEWVTIDPQTGKIYMTETGRDNPASRWIASAAAGAEYAPHHMARAMAQGVADPGASDYWDYYGRVLVYDPANEEVSVQIEGGPFFATSPAEANYPSKHLSNPDGLSHIIIDGQTFLVIQEDLNGTSFGRTPAGISNRMCELFLLNASIENPTWDDLIRITATPAGAEVTGAVATSDGASLIINSQHPNSTNPFPFNHSLTFAINGFDQLTITDLEEPEWDNTTNLQMFPNPTTRQVNFNKMIDAAIYNVNGQRLNVYRAVNSIDVSHLPAGQYYIQTQEGEIKKLIIQ
jgi:secreted PhoX family phosphatase